MAQSAMGPFYCPPDRQIFLDTGFFRQVETRFHGCSGNACKFTAAYIIAHEAGHHIQNLLGILPRVTRLQQQAGSKAEANALQVKVELQADCLSGVWVNREGKEASGLPGSGRYRRGADDGFGDRRRHAAAASHRARGAGFVHAWLRRATKAMVHDRLSAGHRAGLQHVRLRSDCDRAEESPVCLPSMKPNDFVPLNIAVLTISDTRIACGRQVRNHTVGPAHRAGHQLAAREIISDDVEAIRAIIKQWIAGPGRRCHHHHRRHRLHRSRRDAGGDRAVVRKADGWLLDRLPHAEPRENRDIDNSKPRHCRGGGGDVYLLPAGIARRLSRRLGRHSRRPARLPHAAVQFRRDHAAARRASAAAESKGRLGLRQWRSDARLQYWLPHGSRHDDPAAQQRARGAAELPQQSGLGAAGIRRIAAEPLVVVACDQQSLIGRRTRDHSRNEFEAVTEAAFGIGRAGIAEDAGARPAAAGDAPG